MIPVIMLVSGAALCGLIGWVCYRRLRRVAEDDGELLEELEHPHK
jgi:hypothetical protein